ncbi:hypothetical protein DFH08DRAFT_880054 [Mycena albidolilacea]|uniref:Uncharacterized protein n=1 Tax=Mycena albidolilacea TaxID=1033008 RepID=A0AAD7EM09_9AGAR|nr:hypothetical protein DFH08DRAFT_880054 [Mycena albidolilacea]
MADPTNPFAAFAGLTMSYLEDTLGVFYIGYTIGTVGFGFTFFQSYLYYTLYPKDSWFTQLTVASLCTLDTAMSALSSHTLYYYFVTLFALPVGPDNATTSFCVEVILSGIVLAIVQGFYALRIWQVTQNAVLPAAIIVLAIAGAALGIATGVVMFQNTLFTNFSERYMKAIISTGQGLRLLAAIATTAGFLGFGVKSGSSGKPSSWDPITNFLTSGVAGVIVQLLCFATFIGMPKKYVWIVFHFLSSRVFINGLLLMLNSRAVSEGRGVNEEDTRYTARGIDPTKSAASGLMFNSTTSRNTNHTVNIEVSRVVNSDMAGSKYRDDFDSYSIGKDGPHAL